jgi:hypothetical protein
MKPRFCTSPIGVSDAVSSACRTYSTLYDAPNEAMRSALEAYIHRLVIQGERNQHQLMVKALIYLQKHDGNISHAKSRHGGAPHR